MENVYILAPDLGNSYTHFVNPKTLKVESFPSLVAPGRKIRDAEFFGDLVGYSSSKNIQEMVLKAEEGTFFIGHHAYLKSRSTVKLSLDTQQSMFVKDKLLKSTMAMTLPQKCQVKLVLGYPYSESEVTEEYINMAYGKHEYCFNGKEYCQEVIEVVTLAQPVAAFLGIVTDILGQPISEYAPYFNTPVVILDIGGGTADFCWIEKNPISGRLEVLDECSASEWLGVWYALGLIRDELEVRYGVQKRLVDLEYELKAKKTEVNINGKIIDISKIKNAMYEQAANDILTFGTNLWGNNKSTIGIAFSAGGGSETFKDVLNPRYEKLFRKHQFADKGSIAKGQWTKAVKLWG